MSYRNDPSISISGKTHSRLRALAKARGLTMRAIVEVLLSNLPDVAVKPPRKPRKIEHAVIHGETPVQRIIREAHAAVRSRPPWNRISNIGEYGGPMHNRRSRFDAECMDESHRRLIAAGIAVEGVSHV